MRQLQLAIILSFMQRNAINAPARVGVLFSEESIAQLFAALVVQRGVEVALLNPEEAGPKETKIITEPCFLSDLSEAQKSRCLLVGDPPSSSSTCAAVLTRPLTEAKIERALSQFLESN